MKLYYMETPNPRKPCAVAKHLNLDVEFIKINLAEGEHQTDTFRGVNPNTKVPALEDGGQRIWESTAIMAYLAQKAGSDMWPTDPAEQVDLVRWIAWDACHFSRHGGTLMFENFIKGAFGLGDPNEAAIEEALGFWRRFAGVLDQHLESRTHLIADRLTIADFAVATFLPTAEQAKLPLDEFANVKAWHERLMQLPAWSEPFPVG